MGKILISQKSCFQNSQYVCFLISAAVRVKAIARFTFPFSLPQMILGCNQNFFFQIFKKEELYPRSNVYFRIFLSKHHNSSFVSLTLYFSASLSLKLQKDLVTGHKSLRLLKVFAA